MVLITRKKRFLLTYALQINSTLLHLYGLAIFLHANKMFLNDNAIADELPNIQFSLTTGVSCCEKSKLLCLQEE